MGTIIFLIVDEEVLQAVGAAESKQRVSFGAVAFWKLSKRQRTIWGRSSRMVVDYQAYLKCLVK